MPLVGMWENLNIRNKNEYKRMILAFASLSEMFAQKKDDGQEMASIVPIVNSKYQETVFNRVFNATAEDIGNTSFDASLCNIEDGLEERYLIGIKTFRSNTSAQKVAQFKANIGHWIELLNEIERNASDKSSVEEINEVNKDLYMRLAKEIAQVRNMRIDSSVSAVQGFSVLDGPINIKAIYHVLVTSNVNNNPLISVGETTYNKIDIEHLSIIGCTKANNPRNFDFQDGIHKYRFTAADSQLLMYFNNDDFIKENWRVEYADDAYGIFSNIADQISCVSNKEPSMSVTWPLDMERNKFSGFNSFYGTGSKLAKETREARINGLVQQFATDLSLEKRQFIEMNLERFLLTDMEVDEKLDVRKCLMEFVRDCGNANLLNEISKLLYRPKDEIYIPIPESNRFHVLNPDFFNERFGRYVREHNGAIQINDIPKEDRTFTLVIEPSGEEIECFITQDNGKGIQSINKQSVLGDWILRKIFQLEEYEPLTNERLYEIGINGVKLFKYNDNKVHLSFVWIDNPDI